MSRKQTIFSALSIGAALLIVPNRIATGSYGWAAFWVVVGGLHVWLLIDSVRKLEGSNKEEA